MKQRRRKAVLAGVIGAVSLLGRAGADDAPMQPAPRVAYQSKYDDPKNLALWSKPQADQGAGTLFLGRFINASEKLSLAQLPEHKFVRLRAQRCIMDSWDGNRAGDGPDQIGIRLADGRSLMQAAFSMHPPGDTRVPNGPPQSFPDDHGAGSYPGLTGAQATEVNWLPKSTQYYGGNAVFAVEFAFPHAARELQVEFHSSLYDGVPVALVPPPPDMAAVRRILRVGDDEWAVLGPKIGNVLAILNDPACDAVSPAMLELRARAEPDYFGDADLNTALRDVRAQQLKLGPLLGPARRQALDAARAELKKVVTGLRQEAVLITMNILE